LFIVLYDQLIILCMFPREAEKDIIVIICFRSHFPGISCHSWVLTNFPEH